MSTTTLLSLEDRITRLSKIIYRDEFKAFELVGGPPATVDFGQQMLRVLHKIRNGVANDDPVDAELYAKLAVDLPEPPAEVIGMIPPDAEPVAPSHKVCANCAVDKPIEEFKSHSRTKDGRFKICVQCQSEQAARSWDGRRKKPRVTNARNTARTVEPVEQASPPPTRDDADREEPPAGEDARNTARVDRALEEEIEAEPVVVPPNARRAARRSAHTRSIEWAGGHNVVTLMVDVPILHLSGEERRWLINVIDAFERLEEEVSKHEQMSDVSS